MFITFEGPDGCGKTTQIALLADYLDEQGYPVVKTREPGGTPIGEQIRQVVHNPTNQEMAAQAEVLLYSASRAQLVEQVIRPALAGGKVVLCDRFYDSTLAYQGYGRGLDLALLRQLTRFAVGGLRPDLTIYIDVDPEMGLRRRQQDGQSEWNRLDAATLDFHQRARAGYHELIAAEPGRWVVVDGLPDIATIHEEIARLVVERLARRITP